MAAYQYRQKEVEVKKSEKASLESRRAEWFLLGLVMVLSTFYVALEYNAKDSDADTDSMLLEDMAQELEMLPAVEHETYSAPSPTLVAKPSVKSIRVVDKVEDEAAKLDAINSLRTITGDGYGDSSSEEQAETTQATSPVAVDNNDNPLSMRIVEQLPEFPGGMVELMKWITKNLKYPYQAQKNKVQGLVVVTFIINRDGSIANIKVDKSVDPALDNEAKRVVRMMPRWKPGLQNDKPCRTMFSIPIEFRL